MRTGSGAGRQTINFSERRAVALALSLDTVPSQSPILLGKAARPRKYSSMSRSFRAAPVFCPLRLLDNLPRTLMKHI